MPLEKRPANPLPKGPRPGSRMPAHKVRDNETLESIAKHYGVNPRDLVLHNFGTLDEKEINWYLRENVGCNLPTHDQKNWRFSSSAQPGLIYLPMRVMEMDPIVITGRAPTKLADLSKPEILASEKFVHEFTIPKEPKEFGYLLAQAKVAVEGEIKARPGGVAKVAFKKNQVRVAVEKKFDEDTTGALGVKFDEKTLEPILNAVKSGSLTEFGKALAGLVEGSLKTAYRCGKVSVTPEIGVQVSKTFITVRVAGEYEDSLLIESVPYTGKFAVKAGGDVGLSAKGWAWVADKVGKPVVRTFLTQGGRALTVVVEWLTAEGVLVAGAMAAGAIVGTFGLVALTAWITNNARAKGQLEGISTFYGAGYSARLFGGNPAEQSTYGLSAEQVKMRNDLIATGGRDAVTDGRAILKQANDPAATGSESQILNAYRELLIKQAGGKRSYAQEDLLTSLREKARTLVGL